MKFTLLVFLLVRSSSYKVQFNNSTKTLQSKTLVNQNSTLAIDGSRKTCSLATGISWNEHAWWKVILHKSYTVYKIVIFFKFAEAIAPYYKNLISAYVSESRTDENDTLCAHVIGAKALDDRILFVCKEPIFGKVITLKKLGRYFHPLMLCEVHVFVKGLYVVSKNKRTAQITTHGLDETLSSQAVDGNNDTCTRIYTTDGQAWWRVEFDDKFYIHKIKINFNQNTTVTEEQLYVKVYVSNEIEKYDQFLCVDVGDNRTDILSSYIDRTCAEPNPFGKILTIRKYGGRMNAMMLCEVTVIANYSMFDDEVTVSEGVLFQKMFCKNDELGCQVLSKFFCLPQSKVCDNVRDCPSGIDEVNCTCPFGHFKCLDGNCIPGDWMCDGIKDCRFGDEEQNCIISCNNKSNFICTKHKKCIDRNQRCDGQNDCDDFSDEQGCFEAVLHDYDAGTYLLMATYKGVGSFYVCTKYWENTTTARMCNHLTGRMMGHHSEYKPEWTEGSKFITLKERDLFDNNLPTLKNFQKIGKCSGIVELFCLWDKDVKKQCGTRAFPDEELSPYIINGDAALLGAWPWQVQIINRGQHFCGGSILNENWILTSASCSKDAKKSDLTVMLGTNKFLDIDVESLEISHIVNHPNHEGFQNDIGLLKLSMPLKFSQTIRPICLPEYRLSEGELKTFKYCIVTGFGAVNRNRSTPLFLMQGRMDLMRDSECAENLADIGDDTQANYLKSLIENDFVCAGNVPTKDGINICQADSGNPLVCKDRNNVWLQVALATTFEYGKNKEECTNSIFTKIDPHLEFINIVLHSEDKLSNVATILHTVAGMIPICTMSIYNVFCC